MLKVLNVLGPISILLTTTKRHLDQKMHGSVQAMIMDVLTISITTEQLAQVLLKV